MGPFKVPDVWTRGELNPRPPNVNFGDVSQPGPSIRLTEYSGLMLNFLNDILISLRLLLKGTKT
jgi:hypothetical protein